jgi:hypothetical protein
MQGKYMKKSLTFEWKKGAVVSERKLVWDILRNWNQQTWLFLLRQILTGMMRIVKSKSARQKKLSGDDSICGH